MPRRRLVQDKEDQTIYAVEMDGNQNIVASFGPIPFHEVGLVLPSRYVMTEDGAADLNARPLRTLGRDEIDSMNKAYADRRGMPVVDGTVQDATQPEAMPETVPTPNPPELGKPEGVAIHDQGDDVARDSGPEKAANMTADEAAASGARSAESEAIRRETEENDGAGAGEKPVRPGGRLTDHEARVAARGNRSSTGEIAGEDDEAGEGSEVRQQDAAAADHAATDRAEERREGRERRAERFEGDVEAARERRAAETGTARDAADSEQYAPREGANMKPGADLRRASQLAGQSPNPQDDQDGRKTQTAENGGLAARDEAIEAGEGQQEKHPAAQGPTPPQEDKGTVADKVERDMKNEIDRDKARADEKDEIDRDKADEKKKAADDKARSTSKPGTRKR